MRSFRIVVIIVFLIQQCQIALAQNSAPAFTDSLFKKFEYYRAKKQQGVLFAHFDKTIYTNNENVWFTAYLLNANTNKNDVLSVVLVNDNDHSIALKEKFVMDKSIAFGNMFLPDSVLSGNYSFMLYTNSVVNGQPENVFVQPVTVKNTNANSYKATLFLEDTAKVAPIGGRKVLLITNAAGVKLISGASVNYYLGDKLHPIIAGTVKTDNAGQYLFTIPTKNITLGNNILQAQITYGKEVQIVKLALPVQKSAPVVRFYPEGGNLSDGVSSVIGWEVKTTEGVPYAVSGVLYKNDKPIDTISTNSYGMGRFALYPDRQSRYYVKLMLADNRDSVYDLPTILSNTPVITMANAIVNDTLRLVLKSKQPAKLYVLVHNYKQIFFSFPVQVEGGGRKLKIELSDLPKGLAEVTILDSLQRPYAERLFFAHSDRKNAVNIHIDSPAYKMRQKVSLKLDLADADGKPITGMVSIAVVQANRVEIKKATDIESYLYLNHQLGALPVKQSYLGNSDADKAFLENILLIKGWRRYTWNEMLETKAADTIHHQDSLNFKANITHFDKPIKKPVTYIVMKDSSLHTGVTNANGIITFANSDIYVIEGKKLNLFVNDDPKHVYQFNIPDPYDKANQNLAVGYIPVNYNNFLLNKPQDDPGDLKGLEHAIHLKEVKIQGKNDNSMYAEPGPNPCGDYVCPYGVFNCPNHPGTMPGSTMPVTGKTYFFDGRMIVYSGCTTPPEKKYTVFDGIHFAMEFYPSDYAKVNPSQPEYLSTVYWNHLYAVSPENQVPISFYTSDIAGEFKIIVQGITDKGVVYGEKTFTVKK